MKKYAASAFRNRNRRHSAKCSTISRFKMELRSPAGITVLRGFSRQQLDFGLLKIDILSNTNYFYYFWFSFCFRASVRVMGIIIRSPLKATQ